MIQIKTTHLFIEPAAKINSREELYNCSWNIYLRAKNKKKEIIGDFHYTGVPSLGNVSLFLTIYPDYRMKGYGCEALKEITEWSFMQKDIYSISTSVSDNDEPAVRLINKAGYIYRSVNQHIETYSITKPKTSWLGLYILLGFIAGLGMGLVFNNVILGLLLGLIIGTAIGSVLDSQSNKQRENVCAESIAR